MNPYILLAGAGLWFASACGAYFYGVKNGVNSEVASQAKIKEVRDETRRLALEGAADAIAKVKVINTTVQGKVETVVRENVVYRDCTHDGRMLNHINEALTGRPGPASDSVVPRVNAVN